MKKVLALSTLFFSTAALAHVEPGIYRGVAADGSECTLEAVKMYYENDMHHPLTERVVVKYAGEEYTLAHPPVVDVATQNAFFNHDVFQGLRPTSVGARAVVIDMIHSEEFEGPGAFHFIDHEWKKDKRTAVDCKNIKLLP